MVGGKRSEQGGQRHRIRVGTKCDFRTSAAEKSARTKGRKMDGRAELIIADESRDPETIAARSAGIWIGLSLDDAAHAALRRDGLDPAALRLTGLHPFEFARAADGGLQVIAHANDNETAEVLLDLFRVYFLRRLLA
mgnify:CR=1 FL=1